MKIGMPARFGGASGIKGTFNNEFLGTWVQVALAERRRIDRIEELPQFGDADLDNLRPS
jgi:hypothetical protein